MAEEFDIKKVIIPEKKKKTENEKALFFQRFLAFMIDILLVSVLASLLSAPFVDSKKLESAEQKLTEVTQEYVSASTVEDFDLDGYMSRYYRAYYTLAKESGATSLVTIFLSVLYYVVYQLYAGGQTLGKKVMKIRVVSEDGELSYNQMIFRSFLANFMLLEMIQFMFLLIGSKKLFFYGSVIFECLQYLTVFISMIMIMNQKDGRAIHDKIAHTKVIREK